MYEGPKRRTPSGALGRSRHLISAVFHSSGLEERIRFGGGADECTRGTSGHAGGARVATVPPSIAIF